MDQQQGLPGMSAFLTQIPSCTVSTGLKDKFFPKFPNARKGSMVPGDHVGLGTCLAGTKPWSWSCLVVVCRGRSTGRENGKYFMIGDYMGVRV